MASGRDSQAAAASTFASATDLLSDCVLDAAHAQVWLVDRDLRILQNRGSLYPRATGRAPEDSIGMTMYELLTPPDGDLVALEAHERALAGEQVAYSRDAYVLPFDVFLRPLRNEAGEVTHVAGVAIDATERRRFETELEEKSHRLHSLLQTLDAIVWECDPETLEFSFVSDYAETLLGYPLDEWYADSRFFVGLIHPEDRDETVASRRAAVASGVDQRLEYRTVAADGRSVWIRDTIRVETDDAGRPAKVCGVMIDVTDERDTRDRLALSEERCAQLFDAVGGQPDMGRDFADERLAEQKHQQSQRLEAVGRLAAGVAHDFNNLLTAIRGHAELARIRPNEAREQLDRLLEAVERARSFTSQLLTFAARRESPPTGATDANEVVERMQALLARLIEKTIDLELDLGPVAAPVGVSSSQLEQIVLNLAVNARDAMPSGGALEIETRLDETAGDPPRRWVAVAVRDTGHGMSGDVLEHAFEPFFTTKGELGTGLGLATVYGIAKSVGGHVTVRSQAGAGTEVSVYLPVADPAVRVHGVDGRPPASVARDRTGGETVLVVEDDELVRELLVDVLRAQGYDVHAANRADDALKLGEGIRVDLVVSDVSLRGLSGTELVSRLRERYPRVKALLLCGYSEEVGTDDVARDWPLLEKPFGTNEFADAVRHVLDAAR